MKRGWSNNEVVVHEARLVDEEHNKIEKVSFCAHQVDRNDHGIEYGIETSMGAANHPPLQIWTNRT
jgi:hypothetical protein